MSKTTRTSKTNTHNISLNQIRIIKEYNKYGDIFIVTEEQERYYLCRRLKDSRMFLFSKSSIEGDSEIYTDQVPTICDTATVLTGVGAKSFIEGFEKAFKDGLKFS